MFGTIVGHLSSSLLNSTLLFIHTSIALSTKIYYQAKLFFKVDNLIKGEEVLFNSGRGDLRVPFHLQRGQTFQLHVGRLPNALVIIQRTIIMS